MKYGTTTAMSAYLALTGRSVTGNLNYALEAGSGYIDAAFYHLLKSEALSYDSEFPREAFNPTPERVEKAAYEAAYQWSLDNTSLSASVTKAGTVKREKVDGAVEVEYFEDKTSDNAIDGAMPRFTAIDGLMAPFIYKEGAYRPSACVV